MNTAFALALGVVAYLVVVVVWNFFLCRHAARCLRERHGYYEIDSVIDLVPPKKEKG